MGKVLKTVGVAVTVAIGTAIGGPIGGTVAAALFNIGMQLTAHPPRAVGQVSGFMVGANNPLPYLMGEAYTEGVEIYRAGYGGKINGVQNPYAFLPRVLSCCGPIQSMGTTLVDYEAISLTGAVGTVQSVTAGGYYADFLFIDQQLGARPESTALAAPAGWGTPAEWSASHKLSGMAARGWSLLWDKKGTRFAGGAIPPLGGVPQGVKVYDPRLDSTYPGGSGSQRIVTESTWAYSTNPALHALAYAYGRVVNGVRVFGVYLNGVDAIDLGDVVPWANACAANGWSVNGTIYEPGDKWNNLKRICEAGGGEPCLRGGVLGFDFQSPRSSLYTVTKDDLVAAPVSARLGRSWKDRHNTLVPRYRSAAHQWNYVQANAVVVASFLTADGEPKIDERQWDLVTTAGQVTELAIYDLWQRREAGPLTITAKPHMRIYQPGDCLTLHADLGMHPAGAVKAVIRRRQIDPTTGVVQFELEADSDAKHTAALGAPGGAPGTVTLPSGADLDAAWFTNVVQLGSDDAYTIATTTITPGAFTFIEVAALTITTSGGSVVLQADLSLEVVDNCKWKFRFLRGGTVLRTLGQITVSTGDNPPMSFAISDTPAAGTYEYTLEVAVNDAGDIKVIDPLLRAFENRKKLA